MKKLAFAFVLLASPAFAQDYTPPTRDQWISMVQALQSLPMAASAHQQLANILTSVQQQAQQSKAEAEKKPDGK